MRSGRSYCGVLYNIVNHSDKQIVKLEEGGVLVVFKLPIKNKSLNTGTMVRSCTNGQELYLFIIF